MQYHGLGFGSSGAMPIDYRNPREPIAQTYGQRVAGMIRDAIVRGELTGGEFLRQEELAARFNISRMPLREALQQLENEGFVTIVPYRGAVVTPTSVAEARDIGELMLVLYPLALSLAFPHLTPDTLNYVEQVLDSRDQAQDAAEWANWSGEFMTALLRPANRPAIMEAIDYVNFKCLRYAHATYPDWKKTPSLKNAYRQALSALRKGNLDAAIKAMNHGHQQSCDALVARLLKPTRPTEPAAENASVPRQRKARRKS